MTIDRFAQPQTAAPGAGPLPATDAPEADPDAGLHALLDVQTLADDLTFHLPPARLEARLGALIRRYVVARSAALAESIICHLQALYLHPALRDAPEQARYRQVAQHWRLLVAQRYPA